MFGKRKFSNEDLEKALRKTFEAGKLLDERLCLLLGGLDTMEANLSGELTAAEIEEARVNVRSIAIHTVADFLQWTGLDECRESFKTILRRTEKK